METIPNKHLFVFVHQKFFQNQECPFNACVPWLLFPHLFRLFGNGVPDNVPCNIAICADHTTFHLKFNQTFD